MILLGLISLRRMLRRAAVCLPTALAVGLYAAAFLAAALALENGFDGSAPLVYLGLAALLGVGLNPLLRRLQARVDRWAGRRGLAGEAILRAYSQRLSGASELNRLAQEVVKTLGEILRVQSGALFLVARVKDEDGRNVFRLQGAAGGTGAAPGTDFLAEGALARALLVERRPLTRTEILRLPRFRDLTAGELEWIAGLPLDVFVPICSGKEWTGLLALGPNFSSALDWEENRELLMALAGITAVALENARAAAGLLRLNQDYGRLHAALLEAQRRLDCLDRAKTDFICIASHELRTPLTLVDGSTQILMADPGLQENPHHRQLLDNVQAGSRRLHETLGQLLDMARIDTQALELRLQPVHLGDLIRSVGAKLKDTLSERGQSLVVQGLELLPVLQADPIELHKVFYQLILNASKYTPDCGSLRLVGRETQVELAGRTVAGVELVVSDTGIGVAPHFQKLIFEKFFWTHGPELHTSGKDRFKGGGTGLGLAIARGIVAAHGGRIWVESTGCDEQALPGSRFHVELPLLPPAAEMPVKETPAEAAVPEKQKPPSGTGLPSIPVGRFFVRRMQ